MKPRPLWQVSIQTTLEGEDAAARLLEELFGQSPTVYVADDDPAPLVSVYVEAGPGGAGPDRRTIARRLARPNELGSLPPGARLRIRRLPPQNWAASWKKTFKAIEIESALLIRPSWSKRRRRPGQSVIVLDPALSFGTGHHATTRFCLSCLVRLSRRKQRGSFLDIGTGSGILAIAAAKLGFGPVRAIDNDEAAVEAAKANARRNQVRRRLAIACGDIRAADRKSSKRFDVVCANLTSDLLLERAAEIRSLVAPGGSLVLAGILEREFPPVAKSYQDFGMRLVRTACEAGWQSGLFEKA